MRSLDDALLRELEFLGKSDRLRKLRRIEQVDTPRVQVAGQSILSFGSNDYLALSSHSKLAEAAKSAARWGSGSTGSRLTSGNFALHEELERELAVFKHSEAAIVFSSGYAANVGTIPALASTGDLILSDELNHASLIDGCRLSRADTRIYRHADVDHARALVADRSSYRHVLVLTDGVFSMDGDLAPLTELVELCELLDCWLMVDDAHGTGVFGETGSGVVEHFGLQNRVPIQMGTLSKALGSAGGFVAGSKPLIAWLRNRARSFVFSTAPPPTDIETARAALQLIQNEPEIRHRLHENIEQLRDSLDQLALPSLPGLSPIIPLIVGSNDYAVRLSSELFNLGVWIPAIRPPTVPEGSARLRITVTAAHTTDDIAFAVSAIHHAWNAIKGCD